MSNNLLNDPDFIYASAEQFKGYCDLDLTNEEWHMAHVVARKIPYDEFFYFHQHKKDFKNITLEESLIDTYDEIASSIPYYHPNEE
tara:strand:+ start:253 stop:510 length:258 start_codon:yes stop_codon:yes gene_type:complete